MLKYLHRIPSGKYVSLLQSNNRFLLFHVRNLTDTFKADRYIRNEYCEAESVAKQTPLSGWM